tara:strand:+ start:4887 stop:6119 length:1233 start_codon:yes stop_codon:yes gene_type:complete
LKEKRITVINLDLNNESNLEEVFIKRLMYEYLAYNRIDSSTFTNPAGVKDYWRLENVLFGKVNPAMAVIQPNKSSLVSIPGQSSTFFTYSSIADRFVSFQNTFKIPSQSGRLAADNYLNSPEIFRSFMDADVSYNEKMTVVLSKHNGELLRGPESDKIRNIKDYAKIFFQSILDSALGVKITKVSYILSPDVSALNSGLSIEIADLNPADNNHKQSFISSDNFEFYRQTAINNGFILDKNIPWRMNYDLSSPITENKDSFLSLNFTETRYEDLNYLISLVVVGYNSLVQQKEEVRQGNCTYTRTTIGKETVLRDVLPLHYWIKRYCQVRNKESGEIYTKPELDKIIQYAIDLNDTQLSYISSKFRLPYLFEGSTVYTNLKKYYLEKNNISLDNFSEHVKLVIKNSINKIY